MYAGINPQAKAMTPLAIEMALASAGRVRARTGKFMLLRPDGEPFRNWHMHYGSDWGFSRNAAYSHANAARRLNFRSLTRTAAEKISIGIDALCSNTDFKNGLLFIEGKVKDEVFSNIGKRAGVAVKMDALFCILLAVRHAAVRNACLINDDNAVYISSMLAVWHKGYGTFFDVNGSPIVYAPHEHGTLVTLLRSQGGV